jgi:hypothetical protein
MGVFKDLLGSGIGAIIGGMVGGPMGAKVGGALAGAALNNENRLAGALSGFGLGSLAPGVMNMAGMMSKNDPTTTGVFTRIMDGFVKQGGNTNSGDTGGSTERAANGQGLQSLGNLLGGNSGNLLLSALLALEKRGGISTNTPAQQRVMDTGERTDYVGRPIYGRPTVYANQGGYIEGPGSGTSDSIPAMIYQDGGPVQEARLSDGEFVMTEDAVRGAGMGDRARGAAEMYRMMNNLERRA